MSRRTFLLYCCTATLILLTLQNCCRSEVLELLPHFESQCRTICPLQNQTEDGHFDVGCGLECKIEQCTRGCELWQRALETSCQVVCNGTQELLPPKEMYCVMGCNDAVNRYFQKLKDEIGTPPAPALVADTLTATSLSLEWEGTRYANISYLVQWRYEEIADTWQYCRNQSWGPHSTVLVENLQPYTKYRFRIALLLSPHHSELIVSEPSLVISTLPGGTPSSPPTIVRATPADSTRVSLSWEPGPFPNGPILSYVLQISELPSGYTALKDIPASENKDFYMFQNLEASRNYSVSIFMRNAAGLGPPATIVVTTPTYAKVKETQQLILILGAHHTVISQAADILEEPVIMYKTTHLIRGVAVHVRKEMLFVSDSSGIVWVASSRVYTSPIPLLNAGANLTPYDLSVDWLNDQLYVLAGVSHGGTTLWQIVRCDLDGQGITVAVAGFLIKPHHMEVDPYNGYLFWVIQGAVGGGLYRLDLADISNGVKHEVIPEQILQSPHLGAFTVDHTNFRILVPNHVKNTVVAVSLDGHEVTDIRSNTQQPQFQNVLSIAMANGLFYWTNGERVLTEEYHAGQDSYFHNLVYPDTADPTFVSVSVNLPSSQPVPVPVNPPTALQAVLGPNIAKTSWTVPHLLGGQGKGAWQNWSYQLSIRDVNEKEGEERRDINSTYYTVHDLRPNTEYVIRAAAYTSAGIGPWSTQFRGKTLRLPSPGEAPTMLWSAAEGLFMSDVTGESVQTLIHRESLKDSYGTHHITDIAWYSDKLYLVTNTSNVYWYNLTSHARGRLRDIDSVGSIAVDWVGKKLYWSNPKQQLIIRGNLNGGQQEPLPIFSVAKELNVDAIKGFIYWSTGHTVESARLNGKQKQTYYPAELFSGKQVMGLTLDMDSRAVYWIVRSYEGSSLFKAVTADKLTMGEEIHPQKVSSLQYPDMQGPLCYFDDHLVWLRDDRYAVIGDMRGQNSAVLSGMSLTELNMVMVMDPALHPPPSNIELDAVNVIPEAVSQKSLRIEGKFHGFNVTWDPISNVNYGQVFYEIKISHSDKRDIVQETILPFWTYEEPDELTPYSPLAVSIRALTYWGASPVTRALLYSPPSVPSQPTNPRVFVSHNRNPIKEDQQEIVALFRWDPPVLPNGVILKYKIDCWLQNSDLQVCEDTDVSASTLELTVPDILENSTVYFTVEACTEVGCGIPTPAVFGDSRVEMPVPRLLLSTGDAVQITDYDKRENRTLSRSGSVVDLAYSIHDDRVYWIDDSNHLVMSKFYTSEKTKLLTLNNTGLCLTIDWVGRFLYWAERSDTEGSIVHLLDLNRGQRYLHTVLSRPHPVVKIQVAPLNSMLYWVEEKPDGIGILMKSQTDGANVQPFFSASASNSRSMRRACNCRETTDVGPAITIDLTEEQNPRLLYVDAWTHHIVASDMDACTCNMVVSMEFIPQAGLPPTSLTVDHRLVYWSNASEGRIYSLAKNSATSMIANLVNGVTAINASGVRNIAALGSHLQPYPVARCLIPKQTPGIARLVNHSSVSITLELPTPERDVDCNNVSLATVRFTVYYGSVNSNGTSDCTFDLTFCQKVESFDRIVTIDGLQPYMNYAFLVALKNHYSELQGVEQVVGQPAVYQTAPGAPSPPQNVTAVILNPTSVRVLWCPPLQLNSEHISYEVFWKREGIVEGLRHQRGQALLKDSPTLQNSNVKWIDLQKLMPGQEYVVWVRANSESNEIYSDSETISVKMYPRPNDIVLLTVTPYSLNISWSRYPNRTFVRHELVYSKLETVSWMQVPLVSSDAAHDYFFLDHLTPKTRYVFRLKILFTELVSPYVWPSDNKFTYETLGDKPSKPGVPMLQQLRGDIYQVIWVEPLDNGGKIDLYWLEGRHGGGAKRERREANFSVPVDNEWILFYNGTENYWIMAELSVNMKYQFRVRAHNRYGWSEFSDASEWFDLNKAAMLAEQELGAVIWIFTPLAVLTVSFLMMAFMCTFFHKREKEKKAIQIANVNTNMIRTGNTDVELATLRELPRRGNFIHNSNELYTAADFIPTDREIALFPHIRRDQITLTKFLGSGAFGEVFEGKAKSLPNSDGAETETRVAVKTLRKGATEQEKLEFLKEAQLMSNFKHAHILQLLGVCLDNDPNFIIMELMEGGDLLSYLRASRPLIYTESSLTLLDLMAMCVDVARGCRYLEEMHFVHRDLACRNCLVSSNDPQTRIVKIGDFGLARDIYKNDYYRKEGEGLLPVRWMAPESLVDGVFTCQSDVWAFGVLMWEIMSLGQQPYPARNNLEVLHYVRNGGRLSKPNNSTQQMYELMMKCWSFLPEQRPTFKYILDTLDELKRKSLDTPVTAVHNGQLITPVNENSVKNESENTSQEEVRSSESEDVPVGGIPKYLELIYDEEDTGYEVPRPPASAKSVSEQVPLVEKLVSSKSSSEQTPLVEKQLSDNKENSSSLEQLLPPRTYCSTDSTQIITYSNVIKHAPVTDINSVRNNTNLLR